MSEQPRTTSSNEVAHTPGPWRWLPSDNAIVHDASDYGAHEIAWSDADYQLMAASPDLLAALKSLSAWLGGKCVEGDTIGSMRRMLADAARAIAKAEGR